jgi:hypothetical protein
MGPGYANKCGDKYKYYYYTCWKSRKRKAEYLGDKNPKNCQMAWIKAENLEETVWTVVEELIMQPEEVRTVIEKMALEANDNEIDSLAETQKRLQDLNDQRKILLRSFRDGLLPEEDFRKLLQEIAEEEKFLQRRIESAGALRKNIRSQVSVFEVFHRSYCDTIKSLTDEERREIILALIQEVRVFKDGSVRITFNPPEKGTSSLTVTTQLKLPYRWTGIRKRGRRKKKEYIYINFPTNVWEQMRMAASQTPISVFIMQAVKEWLDSGEELNATAYFKQRVTSNNGLRRTPAVFSQEILKTLIEKKKETGVSISLMIRAAIDYKLQKIQQNNGYG